MYSREKISPMVNGTLKNLGHTCYFNSVLQAMFGLNEVSELLNRVAEDDTLLSNIQNSFNEEENAKALRLKDLLSLALEKGRRGTARSISARITKFISYLESHSLAVKNQRGVQADSPTRSAQELHTSLSSPVVHQFIRLYRQLVLGEESPASPDSSPVLSSDSTELSDSSDSTERGSSTRTREVSNTVNPMSAYLTFLAISPYAEAFEQADVAECYHTLVERLNCELIKAVDPRHLASSISFNSTFSSPVCDIFRGFSETQTQCHNCGYLSEASINPFIELQLQIPRTFVNAEYFINKFTGEGQWQVKPLCIVDCVQHTIRHMAGNPCIFCSSDNVSYSTSLKTLPRVLVLNLNRAHFYNGRSTKNTSHIEIASELAIDTSLYSLEAIIVHRGGGSQGGHYSCYSKRSNVWMCFDDASVTEIGSFEAVGLSLAKNSKNLQPCLIFYSRIPELSRSATTSGYVALSPGHVS